eukprot:5421807-Amphidinium_carterae.1
MKAAQERTLPPEREADESCEGQGAFSGGSPSEFYGNYECICCTTFVRSMSKTDSCYVLYSHGFEKYSFGKEHAIQTVFYN